MVMIMNKNKFIKTLAEKTKLTLSNAETVNNILENNFFISKKSKDKIIKEIVSKLNVSLLDATSIYNIAKEIINEEIKKKVKHPFKSQD